MSASDVVADTLARVSPHGALRIRPLRGPRRDGHPASEIDDEDITELVTDGDEEVIAEHYG
jgi:hypothetical protein